jgi:ribosomal protein L7/L12
MDIKTTGTDPERWMSLVRAGAKIEAIKEYRNQTGIGLKSSKDFIEFMWDFIRPPVAVAA